MDIMRQRKLFVCILQWRIEIEPPKHIADTMKVRINLQDMKALCEKYLLENGADSFKKDNIGGIMQAFLPLKIE